MAANEIRPCKVAGLYSLVDLQKVCTSINLKLSEEAGDKILYTILKRLGPKLAAKAVHKLIDGGYLSKETNEYEVEKIVDKCFCKERSTDVYLVKWKHWPSNFNTWEPLSNLEGCETVVQDYEDKVTSKSNTSILPLKRKHESMDDDGYSDSDSDDEYLDDHDLQIKDVFTKLRNSENKIDTVTLIQLSGIADEMRHKVKEKLLKPHLKRQATAWATKKKSKAYQEHKASLKETLKAWESKFNSVYSNCKATVVENDVDLEAPPENFKFINDYLPMPGLELETNPVIGCSCEDRCCASAKKCCPHNSDASFAYTMAKRVRLMPGSAIYECNSKCTCGPDCWNRVVQLGSQVKLAIFKTKNGCGWGVKAKQKIKKGTFIMEYLGEIITNEEAEKRGQVYDSELFTYLFDLDFDTDNCQFTVDARNYGNISHFVNHSCDPNMSVYGVWINNLDTRLPRIALFANRDISNGEEISFDYKMTGDTSEEPPINPETGLAEPGQEKTTPAKMSPFKHSPLRSPLFRKPSVPSSNVPAAENLPAASVDETPEVESKISAKTNLLKELDNNKENINPSGREIHGGGSEMHSGGSVVGESISTSTEGTFTKIKAKDDVITQGTSTRAADEVSFTSDSIDNESNISTPSKSKFSCKNYRIVCHCGAKNCRKFLF